MSDLGISDLAEITGLSNRYWQRQAESGKLPGAGYIQLGTRRRYVVDAETFKAWWSKQRREIPCQKISGNGVTSGGTGSPKTAPRTKVRFKPETLDSRKTALKAYEKA